MNNMDATIPQPQGQTEKMLNYKVSDLGAFSVHEQKSWDSDKGLDEQEI